MKRPLPITILAVVLIILAALNVVSIVATVGTASIGRTSWIIGTFVVSVASIYGLWRMRIWGPILYLASYLVGWIAFFVFPPADASTYLSTTGLVIAIAIPAIYLAVVLPYRNRFRFQEID